MSPTETSAALAINGGTPASASPIPFMSVGLTEQDIAAANEVLRSGMLRAASKCAELESRFAELSDAKHALTCSNGTCALELAYHALLQPGDEVICPAWTYIATASMLVARGCEVVFCDCLPDSFQIDPEDVERRITPKTQAIADKHGLKVIYDAAQAHLAEYKGKGIGAYGDAATYSFYATKNLGTGEGGMVLTNDDTTAEDMGLLRSHGEPEKYLHTRIGFNYRMNDITGAIGLSKLTELPGQTDRRRAVAERYHAIVDAINGLDRPHPTEGSNPAWHLYTVRVTDALSCTRDEFSASLKAEGVPSAVHYPKSLTDQPAFADTVARNAERYGADSAHPQVSRRLSNEVLSIPMHHDLSDAQIDAIGEALDKIAAAFRG